jgi:hypothetical protein
MPFTLGHWNNVSVGKSVTLWIYIFVDKFYERRAKTNLDMYYLFT